MEEKIANFKDLIVWQKAHQLVLSVYAGTRAFPDEERFGLVSQMRRAAYSVPANVAEGFARRGTKDKLNFYNMAQASAVELEYFILLSRDLGYLKNGEQLTSLIVEVQKLLAALAKSIRSRNEIFRAP